MTNIICFIILFISSSTYAENQEKNIDSEILMYNYAVGKIEAINPCLFDESDASIYLIQIAEVLDAYNWMRENRKQYSMLECVKLVNIWWRNGSAIASQELLK